jgi:signal transduction histidine kinase
MYSILVVDDEPDNFDVIEAFLDQEDYDLHYANSGEKAIAALDATQPDLILLDVMMPNMSGIEVCQTIKSSPLGPSIPIIVVTALGSKTMLAQCLQAGADDFISKPVDRVELRARVQSMLRIRQHHKDQQALMKLRQDMVNIVVHDLRTPLSSIFFGLDTLTTFECDRDQQQSILANMQYAGHRLQALTDEMLIMAKIEDGKFFLDRAPVDITEFISSSLIGFSGIALKKKVTIISDLPPDRHLVSIDRTMLRRVIENLLANAIKFSSANDTIVVKAALPDADQLTLSVSDQGPGIAQNLRQKIFEKYETGPPMDNVMQVGLGLAFCKMVVEAHGGSIQAHQNHPKGSVFEIIIPTQTGSSCLNVDKG